MYKSMKCSLVLTFIFAAACHKLFHSPFTQDDAKVYSLSTSEHDSGDIARLRYNTQVYTYQSQQPYNYWIKPLEIIKHD